MESLSFFFLGYGNITTPCLAFWFLITRFRFLVQWNLDLTNLYITKSSSPFSHRRLSCKQPNSSSNIQLRFIPFLNFSRDQLRSTLGIIYGRGSFAVHFGDHLWYCTVLESG